MKKLLLRGSRRKNEEEAACSAAEQSQEREEKGTEIINETETTLSLCELQYMQKGFSHQPGKKILSWLLWCWDIWADSQELDGKVAQQLGSFASNKATNKGTVKGAGVLSLDGSCQVWRTGIPLRKILKIPKENGPLREVSGIFVGGGQ